MGHHVDAASELEVHNDFSNEGLVRIRWTEVNGYDSDAEGSLNNGMHHFRGTAGGSGNMQLEAHEARPSSDIHCVELVYGSYVGYVGEPGIQGGAVPVL